MATATGLVRSPGPVSGLVDTITGTVPSWPPPDRCSEDDLNAPSDSSSHALSVDLEEYFQVSNFDRIIDRSAWDGLPQRVEAQTQRLLDRFDETHSRATFFVLGWVAERQPRLIRQIAERGHEIACHGYDHRLVYDLTPDSFRADLARARIAIEDAAGVSPVGYRAPSYSITRRSLWALDVLIDEGFEYDSSIFPTRHPRYGIPDFSRTPVLIQLADGRTIREFPMTTIPFGRFNLPLAGGAYLRFFPPLVFRWGLNQLNRRGEPVVLYVHPWEIDPAQPRLAAGLRVRINHYFNLSRTEDRLVTLLSRFRFNTLRNVLDSLHERLRLETVRVH